MSKAFFSHAENDSRRADTDPNRVKRLLAIVAMAIEGRGFDSTTLCDRFNVSRRTVYRDLSVLCNNGFDIRYDSKMDSYRLFRVDSDL